MVIKMIKNFNVCSDDTKVGVITTFVGLITLMLSHFFQLPLFIFILGFLSAIVGLKKTIISFLFDFSQIKKKKLAESAKIQGFEKELIEAKLVLPPIGELIHGLGNLVVDKKITLGNITVSEGKQLQEIGHLLRSPHCNIPRSHSSPELYANCIDLEKKTNYELIIYADSIINKATINLNKGNLL